MIDNTNTSNVDNSINNSELPIVTFKKCVESDCFYGQKTYRWNPKTKYFIYCKKNGNYIINLSKTIDNLNKAFNAIKEIIKKNGQVLFVCTKKQLKDSIIESALRSESFYVVNRWLGGILTNFRTIQSRIQHLKNLERIESNFLDKMNKKEISNLKKEKNKLLKNLKGIKDMRHLPQAIFIVDPEKDKKVINEAKKLKIDVFAIVNTNNDPSDIQFPIPANNYLFKSIKLILDIFTDAIVEAKGGTTIIAYNNGKKDEVVMNDVINLVNKRFLEKKMLRKNKTVNNEENKDLDNSEKNKSSKDTKDNNLFQRLKNKA